MKKGLIITGAILAVGALFLIIVAISTMGVLNTEADRRVLIENKQKDNENEFDNMWKKIAQTAQVPEAQKNALKEIIIGNAQARAQGQGGNGGALATWIHEAVPNVDGISQTYQTLMNIIVSSQDGFTFRQKELLALNTAHNQPFRHVIAGTVLKMFGRTETTVVIVTSTKTENAFKSGKNDDIQVFPTAQPSNLEKK